MLIPRHLAESCTKEILIGKLSSQVKLEKAPVRVSLYVNISLLVICNYETLTLNVKHF